MNRIEGKLYFIFMILWWNFCISDTKKLIRHCSWIKVICNEIHYIVVGVSISIIVIIICFYEILSFQIFSWNNIMPSIIRMFHHNIVIVSIHEIVIFGGCLNRDFTLTIINFDKNWFFRIKNFKYSFIIDYNGVRHF